MAMPLAKIIPHFTRDDLDVIRWYWFDRRDQHEIADWLNCSVRTVGTRLGTIRARMRELGVVLPERTRQTAPCRNVRSLGGALALI